MHEALIKTLIAMKKDPLFSEGVYAIEARENDVIVATWTLESRRAVGVFSMKGRSSEVRLPLSDGAYSDLLSGSTHAVRGGTISVSGAPLIFLIG